MVTIGCGARFLLSGWLGRACSARRPARPSVSIVRLAMASAPVASRKPSRRSELSSLQAPAWLGCITLALESAQERFLGPVAVSVEGARSSLGSSASPESGVTTPLPRRSLIGAVGRQASALIDHLGDISSLQGKIQRAEETYFKSNPIPETLFDNPPGRMRSNLDGRVRRVGGPHRGLAGIARPCQVQVVRAMVRSIVAPLRFARVGLRRATKVLSASRLRLTAFATLPAKRTRAVARGGRYASVPL